MEILAKNSKGYKVSFHLSKDLRSQEEDDFMYQQDEIVEICVDRIEFESKRKRHLHSIPDCCDPLWVTKDRVLILDQEYRLYILDPNTVLTVVEVEEFSQALNYDI